MTDEEIKHLRALCALATQGPWELRITETVIGRPACSVEGLEGTRANALFIAAARTAVPALLDEVALLRAAWKVTQEKHDALCGVMINLSCTCGLHVRKVEARKVLDGEVDRG